MMSSQDYQQQQQQNLQRKQQLSYRHSNYDTGGENRNYDVGNQREEQQQQQHVPHTAASTILAAVASNAPSTSLTAPTTSSDGTSATTTPPPVTEQIANLFILSQHLLSSVREQQQQIQNRQAHRNRRFRLQPTTPYQRPASETLQSSQSVGTSNANINNAPENGSVYSNFGVNDSSASTSASANDGTAGGSLITNGSADIAAGPQLDETQFCSCAECLARLLRGGIEVANGMGPNNHPSAVAAPAATAAAAREAHSNQVQRQESSSSSRGHQHQHKHRHHSKKHVGGCHDRRDSGRDRCSSGSSASGSGRSARGRDNIEFHCSICLDSYLLHRPMATQCGHIFCKRCIQKCVKSWGKCPMCNRKLNSTDMFRVYF